MKISRRGFFGRTAALAVVPSVLRSVEREVRGDTNVIPIRTEWSLALLDPEGIELSEEDCPGYSRRGLLARMEDGRCLIECTGEAGETYKATGDWRRPMRFHEVYCGKMPMYRYTYPENVYVKASYFASRRNDPPNTLTLAFGNRRVLDINKT